MQVLVIEDDAKIASFLENGFREAGYGVEVVHDGMEGLDRALIHDYAVAVVDLMLPSLDGKRLIAKLREEGVKMPVIILSAKGSVTDRIEGLRSGGDDYLVKPFSFSELLARVEALLRRSGLRESDAAEGERILRVGELELDPWKREARRAKTSIPLHAREFALLELLMRNAGRVVSKTAILENVYGYSFDPQTNVVDVLVHRVRKKVDDGFEPKLIHTLRGMGYVVREGG